MTEPDQTIEWYLARDGKQHGPLTEVEMRKLAELGHLRPTDLVWRQGLPNWMAAATLPELARPVAPPPPPPPAPPPPPPAAQPPATALQPTAAPRTAMPNRTDERGGPAPAPGPFARPLTPAPASPGAPLAQGPLPGSPSAGGLVAAPQAPGPPAPGALGGPSGPALSPRSGPDPRAPHQGPHILVPMPPSGTGAGVAGAGVVPPAGVTGIGVSPHGGGAAVAAGFGPADARHAAPRSEPYGDEPERRSRIGIGRVLAVLFLAVLVGAAGAVWVKGGFDIGTFVRLVEGGSPSAGGGPPVVKAPDGGTRVAVEPQKAAVATPAPPPPAAPPPPPAAPAQPPASAPPAAVVPATPATNAAVSPPPPAAAPTAPVSAAAQAEVDRAWQRQKLWQILKRDYPDWYGERVRDAARLKAEQKDEATIASATAQALVKLRRESAAAALAASPARLKVIAATFVENLERLARHSTDACFAYISAGELHPTILELARGGDLADPLQAQLVAIFEAAADGRKAPRAHGQAQREDFDELAGRLGQRRWTSADLQLFSDARQLSRAAPARVCKMVGDWFAAQLDVTDEARQMRLLVETLKPIVAG